MIQRELTKKLFQLSEKFPVVTVTGPRQSGKTTLVKAVFTDYDYATLEDPDIRLLAQDNPREFLRKQTKGLIIDEVQRVPKLFSYLQGIVDNSGRIGEFILQPFKSLPTCPYPHAGVRLERIGCDLCCSGFLV